jgi:protein SDA1
MSGNLLVLKSRNDAKTVNVLTKACFSKVHKISLVAIHFLLHDNVPENNDSDDDDGPNLQKLQHAQHVSGKSKSKAHKMEKARAQLRKKGRKEKAKLSGLLAIHQVNDPQGIFIKLIGRICGETFTPSVFRAFDIFY